MNGKNVIIIDYFQGKRKERPLKKNEDLKMKKINYQK